MKPTPIDVREEYTDEDWESQDEMKELPGSTFAEELFPSAAFLTDFNVYSFCIR